VNIFIGNLACTTTAQDLRQLFEPYGTVDTIEVITDWETGHPCGFGFVEMPERSAARAAIAGLHGMDFGGYACMVNEAYWWVRDYETS
jgi:RNA recognition motif-containing protein